MAEPNLHIRQNLRPQVMQRTVLVGRVKMAQAIKLPESEWAKMLSEVEKDPLFQELVNSRAEGRRIIKYKRFAHTQFAGQFYDAQDVDVVGGGGESPETLLDQKKHIRALIEKIGQENFEKYFLYRDTSDTNENIAAICGITIDQAEKLKDFIIDMSVQAEFYNPSGLQSETLAKPTLIGRIVRNDDKTFSISYFSPHLARGMYEIDRDALRRWQKSKKLDRQTAVRLRRYIGILELSNLKQGSFWRVIDYSLKAQKEYLETGDITKMEPVSLRKVAAKLQFAPSTISRVLSGKSVLLPWDTEVMMIHLMPGQRKVLLEILEKLRTEGFADVTDVLLTKKIEDQFHVKISRRTVTACRHALQEQQKKAA